MDAKDSVLGPRSLVLTCTLGHILEAGKNPVPGSRWAYLNTVDLRFSALGPLG